MKVVRIAPPSGFHEGKLAHDHVVGTALLLVTELMLFCGLIAAYLVLRGQAGVWPPEDQPRLPVLMTAFTTALLLASGWVIWRCAAVMRAGDLPRLGKMLTISLILGFSFLLLQGAEWIALLSHGLTTSSSLYGSTFYAIVGCHGLHVFGALVALGVMTRRIRHQVRHAGGDACGVAGFVNRNMGPFLGVRMFWLFVVAVWPPLYSLVYLW